ncbi:hypothetical protein JL721_8157 [Aureococcus anophagefferens]|nr:hypothetical protein JL721_8157 [Aureococcus anophagefferens]
MLLTKEDPPAATALLEAAAEAGCAPAMVPLALRLLDQGGDAREAESWLWRGARLGCDVAARALDERCQLSADVRSVLAAARDGAFSAAPPPKSRGAMRTMLADKAALGSLVLCLRKHALPTCLLDKLLGRPAALACAAAVRDFETLAENAADERRVRVIVAYGRALSAAEHDREVPRSRGPSRAAPTCGPCSGRARRRRRRHDAGRVGQAVDSTAWDWRTTCAHERKKTSTPHCAACLRGSAPRRRRGSDLGLSVDAHREVHDAAYARADGAVAHEPFARYAMGEVDSVLALLAAAPEADALLHPLFIASDPNLLWPALYFYGSLANALRAFRPDAPASVPPHRPLVCGVADGEPLILACGARGGLCRQLRCGKCSGLTDVARSYELVMVSDAREAYELYVRGDEGFLHVCYSTLFPFERNFPAIAGCHTLTIRSTCPRYTGVLVGGDVRDAEAMYDQNSGVFELPPHTATFTAPQSVWRGPPPLNAVFENHYFSVADLARAMHSLPDSWRRLEQNHGLVAFDNDDDGQLSFGRFTIEGDLAEARRARPTTLERLI